MNKKIGVLFLFLILFGNFIFASNLDSVQEKVENAEEKFETAKEFTEEDKWNYLGEQWKEIFLKNKFFSKIDDFCKEINPVFVIFLGENYEFSLTLFFVFIFWVFILLVVFFLIKDYTGIIEKKWICFLIGIIVSSLIAQSGAYRQIAEILFKFLFFKGGFFDYIFIFIFLVILFVVFDLFRGFGKKVKAEREEIDEEQAKQDRFMLNRIVKIFTKSLGSENKEVTYKLENKTSRIVPKGKDLTEDEIESYYKIINSKSYKDWQKRHGGK